jgi:hypothetical protein
MALESNTDIRLLNGLLPVSSVSDLLPAFSFASINICFHTALHLSFGLLHFTSCIFLSSEANDRSTDQEIPPF